MVLTAAQRSVLAAVVVAASCLTLLVPHAFALDRPPPVQVWTRPGFPAGILPRGDTAWVWTYGGLLHVDANGRVIKKYTTDDGLPSNSPASEYATALIAGSSQSDRPVYVATTGGVAALDPATGRTVVLGPHPLVGLRYDPASRVMSTGWWWRRDEAHRGSIEGPLPVERDDGSLAADVRGVEGSVNRDWLSWELLNGMPLCHDRWYEWLRKKLQRDVLGFSPWRAAMGGERIWALGRASGGAGRRPTTLVEAAVGTAQLREWRPEQLPAPVVSDCLVYRDELWLLCHHDWEAGRYGAGYVARLDAEGKFHRYTLGQRKLFRPEVIAAEGDALRVVGIAYDEDYEGAPERPSLAPLPEGCVCVTGRYNGAKDGFAEIPVVPTEGIPGRFRVLRATPAEGLLLALVLAPSEKPGIRFEQRLATIDNADGRLTWLKVLERNEQPPLHAGSPWARVGDRWWHPTCDGFYALDPRTGAFDRLALAFDYPLAETMAVLADRGRLYVAGVTPDNEWAIQLFRGHPGEWDQGTTVRDLPAGSAGLATVSAARTEDGTVWIGLPIALPMLTPVMVLPPERVPEAPDPGAGLLRLKQGAQEKLLEAPWLGAETGVTASFGPLDEPRAAGEDRRFGGNRRVSCLAATGDQLWIGTHRGVYRLQDDAFSAFGPERRSDDPERSLITGLWADGDLVWMATPKGIRYHALTAAQGQWREVPEITFNKQAPFRQMPGSGGVIRAVREAAVNFAPAPPGLVISGPCLDGTYLAVGPTPGEAQPQVSKLEHAPVHVYEALPWRDRVLMLTAKALHVYDPASDRSAAVTHAEGLPAPTPSKMALDGDTLWLAGENYLARLDLARLGEMVKSPLERSALP